MLSEVSFKKEGNSPWGFRLTGGPQFGMPLTVFEVEEEGRAFKAGIRLGDILIRINGMEADQLSLDDAHNMIREAGNNINLSISNLEDQELRENEELAKAVALNLTDADDTDTELSSHEIHKSDVSIDDSSEIQNSESGIVKSEQSIDEESELIDKSEYSVEDTSEQINKSEYSVEDTSELINKSEYSVEDTSELINKSEHSVQDTSELITKSEHSIEDTSELVTKSDDSIDTSEVAKSEQSVEMADSRMPKAIGKKKKSPVESLSESLVEEQAMDEEEQFVDVHSLPLLPPRPAPEPEKAQRRCWHPVMLDTNPPPIIEETTGDEEYPHKKKLRDIRAQLEAKKRRHQRKEQKGSKEITKVVEIAKKPQEEGPVAAQLRTMQRQLEQLVLLPAAIQETLAAVSSKIQTLLPSQEPEPEELSDADTYGTDDGVQTDDSGDILEEEISESFDVITEEEDSDMEALQHPASQSESEPLTPTASPTPPPPTEEELQKLAKVQKLESLNKCWPWADNNKQVYKIADHYEPVYARCINNKVKWLEQKVTEENALARRLKGI